MSKILIIEDDSRISVRLNDLALKVNPNVEVFHAGSCSRVKEVLRSHRMDAFFVDIQLEDCNGLDLAKEIRREKHYQFVPMVFITAVPSRELEAFKQVHSYDYILKPFREDQILKVFHDILIDYFEESGEEESILLAYKNYNLSILTKDILFIEIISRRILIVTKTETIEYNIMPLKKFQTILPDGFLRIHQSIVINTRYITSFSLTMLKVKLEGYDQPLSIGRSYKQIVKGVFNDRF